jgi:hypothetical protein
LWAGATEVGADYFRDGRGSETDDDRRRTNSSISFADSHIGAHGGHTYRYAGVATSK